MEKRSLPLTFNIKTAAVLLVCLLCTALMFLNSIQKDYYSYTDTEVSYTDGYEEAEDRSDYIGQVISEGFTSESLYPGRYTWTMSYASTSDRNYFEIIDCENWEVLGTGTYAAGSDEAVVTLTLDRRYEYVEVRSWLEEGELTLNSCTVQSLAPVYTDRYWLLFWLAVYALLGFYCWGRYRLGSKAPLILFFAASAVSMPLFTDHLVHGHDIYFHLTRISGLSNALLAGQFPMRLNPDFVYGAGHLSPVMYPNLFIYIPGAVCALGASCLFGYKLLCILAQFATAFIGYGSMKHLFGEKAGLWFALLYLLNPYRLNDLLIRSATGEALAMTFLPAAAAGIWLLVAGDRRKGFWWGMLGITGVFQCHIITATLLLIFGGTASAVYVLMHLKQFFADIRRILTIIGAALCTILLNFWYLVPFLYYTTWDLGAFHDTNDLSSSSVYFWQYFMDEFAHGGENSNTLTEGDMSYSIGFVLLLLAVVFLLYLAEGKKLDPFRRSAGLTCFAMGGIALFMSSNLFPWDILQEIDAVDFLFGSMQFSWRILTIASLMFCMVGALTLEQLQQDDHRELITVACTAALYGAFVILVGFLSQQSEEMATKSGRWDHNALYQGLYLRYEDSTTGVCKRARAGYTIGDNGAAVTASHKEQLALTFSFEGAGADSNTVFETPLYYNGFHIACLEDGTSLPVTRGKNGMLCVTVPAGVTEGTVHVVYHERALFRAAELVTLVTALGLAGYAIIDTKRKKSVLLSSQ